MSVHLQIVIGMDQKDEQCGRIEVVYHKLSYAYCQFTSESLSLGKSLDPNGTETQVNENEFGEIDPSSYLEPELKAPEIFAKHVNAHKRGDCRWMKAAASKSLVRGVQGYLHDHEVSPKTMCLYHIHHGGVMLTKQNNLVYEHRDVDYMDYVYSSILNRQILDKLVEGVGLDLSMGFLYKN
ncbi:hypothetical protein Fot_24508 [Forsythia ovata]|uniref:Uncharacterized protein n=1 Tax=Forsythia ovata TaxID=205694 RepID=A0ABD1U6G9_9LAMI